MPLQTQYKHEMDQNRTNVGCRGGTHQSTLTSSECEAQVQGSTSSESLRVSSASCPMRSPASSMATSPGDSEACQVSVMAQPRPTNPVTGESNNNCDNSPLTTTVTTVRIDRERQCNQCISYFNTKKDRYKDQNADGFYICKKCYDDRRRQPSSSWEGHVQLSNYIGLSAHDRCTFGCGAFNGAPSISVDNWIRTLFLVEYNYWIPTGARMCRSHLETQEWDTCIRNNNHDFTQQELEDMILFLRNELKDAHKRIIDFETFENIPDDLFYNWIGFNKNDFRDLLSALTIPCTKPKAALALYLAKLRTGDPIALIAGTFGVATSTAIDYITHARDALAREFVPFYLDNYWTREQLLAEKTTLAHMLHTPDRPNSAVLIIDGTYRPHDKSMNFSFMRKSYSGFKKKSLYKPLMVVAPNGRIVACLGPYEANDGDDKLLIHALAPNRQLASLLEENDVLIVDRGFRNIVNELKALGYVVKIPASPENDRSTLTDQQANESRLCTKSRCIVEMIHAMIQNKFKHFHERVSNKSLPHDFIDFKIACALLNRFMEPIIIDQGNEEQIAQQLIARAALNNNLIRLATDRNLNQRRAIFNDLNENAIHVEDFPVLTENDLKLIACGSYQLKLAPAYYAEHMKENGQFTIQVCRYTGPALPYNDYNITVNDPILIRAKIHSRFSNNKHRFVYILVDSTRTGRQAIVEYCCSCNVGERTAGCCAHVMVVLWYLGYARHQTDAITRPASMLDDFHLNLSEDEEDADEDFIE